MQAAGIPWWTYDAGGFFRPHDQYTNEDYIERMLRWIEASVYLPLMRVHGYMSNTEPWNYGSEAQQIIADCLKEREQLRPYIDSCAVMVAEQGYTLMRPLVFDFADDPINTNTCLVQSYLSVQLRSLASRSGRLIFQEMKRGGQTIERASITTEDKRSRQRLTRRTSLCSFAVEERNVNDEKLFFDCYALDYFTIVGVDGQA